MFPFQSPVEVEMIAVGREDETTPLFCHCLPEQLQPAAGRQILNPDVVLIAGVGDRLTVGRESDIRNVVTVGNAPELDVLERQRNRALRTGFVAPDEASQAESQPAANQ